jgi:hypothetical protein
MKILKLGAIYIFLLPLAACNQSTADDDKGADKAKDKTTVAETEVALTSAAAALSDGKVWTMLASDGNRVDIVLRSDKTGALQGPISLNINWAVQDGKFCLLMGKMLGEQCMDLKKIPNGFRGYKDGALRVSFTR